MIRRSPKGSNDDTELELLYPIFKRPRGHLLVWRLSNRLIMNGMSYKICNFEMDYEALIICA